MLSVSQKVRFVRSSCFAVLTTAAALGLDAGAASASTTFFASAVGSSIFGGNGHTNVTLYDTSLPYNTNLRARAEGGAAGAFALRGDINNTGVIENFTAFCLDIFDSMDGRKRAYSVTSGKTSDTFNVENGQSNLNPYEHLSSGQIVDVLKLYNTGYNPSLLSTAAYSAGFQIALWEIVNEGNGNYDLHGGSFKVSGNSAVIKEANALLAGLTATNAPNKYKLLFLQNMGNVPDSSCDGSWYCRCRELPAGQNLVTVSTVPLPATGLLLLSAIGGFGFASRRRRRG